VHLEICRELTLNHIFFSVIFKNKNAANVLYLID
jgi:hypothetical protein